MKDIYTKEIAKFSTQHSDKLLELLNYYGVNGLREITDEQAKEFLKKLKEEKG